MLNIFEDRQQVTTTAAAVAATTATSTTNTNPIFVFLISSVSSVDFDSFFSKQRPSTVRRLNWPLQLSPLFSYSFAGAHLQLYWICLQNFCLFTNVRLSTLVNQIKSKRRRVWDGECSCIWNEKFSVLFLWIKQVACQWCFISILYSCTVYRQHSIRTNSEKNGTGTLQCKITKFVLIIQTSLFHCILYFIVYFQSGPFLEGRGGEGKS